MEKDLEYYRKNAEEDYLTTPISVLRYISEMEYALKQQIESEIDYFECRECHEIKAKTIESGTFKKCGNDVDYFRNKCDECGGEWVDEQLKANIKFEY